MAALPALFVSHGSPMMAIVESPARRFLEGLGPMLARAHGRPHAIVVMTAHWETARATLGAAPAPATIHDFYGFPRELYAIAYAAPGAPDLARRACDLLRGAGLDAGTDPARGFDHGVWMPARMMYPEADIPIVPLSVQPALDPAHHHRVGAALRPLREEGVLVMGSGSFTHNLRALARPGADPQAPAPPWVSAFADWMNGALTRPALEDLLDYRRRAPYARENHPTDEHLLPLFAALGAGLSGRPARRLHHGVDHAVLMMDAYAFD